MTSRCDLQVTERRMNGHVKSVHLRLWMEAAAALLCLRLAVAVDSTGGVMASGAQDCALVQQTLKITRLAHKESADLIKTYKASQGEMSEFFCKVSSSDIPVPNISGLEQSDRIASISTRLRAFFPHFRRVYEQQSDLQPPTSALLSLLRDVRGRNRDLASVVNSLYQSLYPNLPGPGPKGAPTKPPPRQNIFQQKVYGCVVLKTYKEFLSNVMREMRMLKSNVCAGRMKRNVQLF
ncbi:IL-6 subfamily cytokine M17 [Takifugu flavidus]|uniref:Ciliary neurotrophic factor n=1 Tax=Takifugu flavidus TaxID=433684 RepID=A0A5C6NJ35_9TELE|nr:IL-6 subfamily cytokine M17 [Takifugu flavidus]TWW66070.1 hypothetical protein D4764_20G0001020 [Takifugu flavidus]